MGRISELKIAYIFVGAGNPERATQLQPATGNHEHMVFTSRFKV